jgi:hypothetical protein
MRRRRAGWHATLPFRTHMCNRLYLSIAADVSHLAQILTVQSREIFIPARALVAALCPPAGPASACRRCAFWLAFESTQARPDPTTRRLPVKALLSAPPPRSVPPLVRAGPDGALPLVRSLGPRAWWSSSAPARRPTLPTPARTGEQFDDAASFVPLSENRLVGTVGLANYTMLGGAAGGGIERCRSRSSRQ